MNSSESKGSIKTTESNKSYTDTFMKNIKKLLLKYYETSKSNPRAFIVYDRLAFIE